MCTTSDTDGASSSGMQGYVQFYTLFILTEYNLIYGLAVQLS